MNLQSTLKEKCYFLVSAEARRLSNINLLRLCPVFHSTLSWETSQEYWNKRLAKEIMMKPIMNPLSHCRQSGAGRKHFIQIKFVDLTVPDMKLYL